MEADCFYYVFYQNMHIFFETTCVFVGTLYVYVRARVFLKYEVPRNILPCRKKQTDKNNAVKRLHISNEKSGISAMTFHWNLGIRCY